MKEIVHDGYDMLHDVGGVDNCFMSNLDAPIVRVGSEAIDDWGLIPNVEENVS